MNGRVFFQGMYFKLNQSCELFNFIASAILGECMRLYDKYIFRTDKGFVAAYVDDLNNWFYI